jgi:TolB-like protein
LPFENLSSSSSEQYFCDGVSEELTTQLSRLDSARLGVAARTTAMQYRHAVKSVADIGRDLKVDYVLEGSVRHDSGQVRVTAQLVRVSDQSHLWAADFDRAGGETLALQSDLALAITRDVAAQLLPALSSASR